MIFSARRVVAVPTSTVARLSTTPTLRTAVRWASSASANTTTPAAKRFRLSEISPQNTANLKKVSYGELKERVASAKVEDLGLRDEVMAGVRAMGVRRPSAIQLLASPEIIAGRHVLCAAETGSGKTLAYLAPIVHRLRHEEQVDGLLRQARRPRALIVVPSKELVSQVESVAKHLSHHAKFVVEGIYDRKPKCPEKFDGVYDVVVTTPKKLFFYLDGGVFSLEQLRFLVIDEADTLFDKDFGDLTRELLMRVKVQAPSSCQQVFASATIPERLHRAVETHASRFVQIITPRLHRTLPGLKQRFIELTGYGDNKQKALLKVLTELPPADYPTLVFCNTLGSCRSLDAWLSAHPEAGDLVGGKDKMSAFHSRIPKEERQRLLKQFNSGEKNLLVCTDIASRGLDTTRAQHVVCYDFPMTAADYLHRVGRTARQQREGRATSLVSKRDTRLAEEIQKAIRSRSAMA